MAHLAHFAPAQTQTLALKSLGQFESQKVRCAHASAGWGHRACERTPCDESAPPLTHPLRSLRSHARFARTLASLARSLRSHRAQVIQAVTSALNKQFTALAAASRALRNLPPSSSPSSPSSSTFEVNAEGVLNDIPRVALHTLPPGAATTTLVHNYSAYLQEVLVVEWICSVLAAIIRNVTQKSEINNFARNERWHNELISDEFVAVFKKISALHRSAQLETCRVRTESSYREREEQRIKPREENPDVFPASYLLRIVNTDGAVIRDGIEIDHCSNVGSYDMGVIINTSDRIVNDNGVLRYRCERGWVSECTRGQGREPICEVLDIRAVDPKKDDANRSKDTKGTECGICDLATVGANTLSRLQTTFKM
jgi:hypothetical protein